MGDLKRKNRLRLKTLPFFLSSSSNSNDETKSPSKFGEEKGVVGLGIVAALNSESNGQNSQKAVFSVSPRSKPIPIFSKRSSDDDDDEEYTCVISHVGSNLVKKREYYDDGLKRKTSYWINSSNRNNNSGGGGGGGGGVVFCGPSPPVDGGLRVFEDGDFLSSCYLCKKKLHGLDIFMYRGEKAFCSEECRYKQICVDEQKDKYARKHPGSQCSSPTPMQLLAGMAAA